MSDEMNEQGGMPEEIEEGGEAMEAAAPGGQGEAAKGPMGPTYGIFESLRVYPVPSTTSKVAGYVSCKIKSELGYIFLNSMALVWGNNGLFLSFPSRKKENSPRGHEDYYFFEREMREKLQEYAILEYKNKGGNMVPPPMPMTPQPGPGVMQPARNYGGPPQGGFGGYDRGGYGQGGGGRYGNQGGYDRGGYGQGGGGRYGNQGGYGQGGYGGNYGNGGYGGNYDRPRRQMGGYDNYNGPQRRGPMSGPSDYTQRPRGGYERPMRPRFNDNPPPEEGNFNTTPIKDGEE
jgi:DNA-binding cell septation regulator SpoVG